MHKGFWSNLKKPIIGLAPMDGITDAAFRLITSKYGRPDLMMTEFTSVEGICHGAVKPLAAFLYSEEERPIVAQIFGSEPEAFYEASLLICELGFDGIDINMGCPAHNVTSRGAGAGLIRTPKLAQEIIKKCQEAASDWANGKKIETSKLPSSIIDFIKTFQSTHPAKHDQGMQDNPREKRKLLPVSVKTRIGYDKICLDEWVKYLLETKPVNITIHGRTLKQMYEGQANWEEIGKAAEIIHQTETMVLGNGDVQSLQDAHEKIQKYKVDGVLIGRASFGNPWIFSSISAEIPENFITAKMKVAVEHAFIYEKIFGPQYFAPMKKHLGWYCKGFANAKEARLMLMQCNSAQEVENAIEKILENLKQEFVPST